MLHQCDVFDLSHFLTVIPGEPRDSAVREGTQAFPQIGCFVYMPKWVGTGSGPTTWVPFPSRSLRFARPGMTVFSMRWETQGAI